MSEASSSGLVTETNTPYPSRGYAWYVVIILYLAYTLSFVDRQIIAFLVDPIKADLHISEVQFGVLTGLAFTLFYTILGIPLGWLADRANRRNLMAVGIGAWSIMTGLCGIASNYWHLFLARIGVGVGEAALGPAAYSTISDNFPRDKRGLPMSVYSAGVLCGAGLANIFGGLVVQYAMNHGPQTFPIIGTVRPWQLSFLLVALPGIIVALMMMSVKESVRREKASAEGSVSLRETFRHLGRYRFAYLTLMLAPSCFALTNYGIMIWVPALYSRVFDWSRAEIGVPFGSIILVLGTAGLVCGGFVVQKVIKLGVSAAYSKVMIVTQLITLPGLALLVAVHSPYWTLGCIAYVMFFLPFHVGLAPAALHSITPNEMRGQVIAIYFFALNTIALALGAGYIIPSITQYVFQNDADVGKSLAIVATIASTIGVISLVVGIRAYNRAIEDINLK